MELSVSDFASTQFSSKSLQAVPEADFSGGRETGGRIAKLEAVGAGRNSQPLAHSNSSRLGLTRPPVEWFAPDQQFFNDHRRCHEVGLRLCGVYGRQPFRGRKPKQPFRCQRRARLESARTGGGGQPFRSAEGKKRHTRRISVGAPIQVGLPRAENPRLDPIQNCPSASRRCV